VTPRIKSTRRLRGWITRPEKKVGASARRVGGYSRLLRYESLIDEVRQQCLDLLAALPGVRVDRVVGLAERQGCL